MYGEHDRAALEAIQETFPYPTAFAKGSFERKIEQNRRQVVIQQFMAHSGEYRHMWGVRYGPYYTHGVAYRALELDREKNPGLYMLDRTE